MPAALIQVLHTFVTHFVHSPGLAYGAPIPVGESEFEFFFGSGIHTFDPLRFCLDLAITWVLVAAIAWWAGGWAAFLAIVASTLALVVYLLTGAALRNVAGFPVPYWVGSPVRSPLIIWADMLLWSAGVAWLIVRLRAGRRDLRR